MKLQQQLKDIATGSYVKVGVLDDGRGAESRGGISNAQIAAIHEFGSRDGRIPERSFLRSTFAAKKPEYLRDLKTLLLRVVEGRDSIERILNVMGAKIAADVKNRVTQGSAIPPPNAPATVKRKGSFRTLIDTGRMIGSVTWAFIKGGR